MPIPVENNNAEILDTVAEEMRRRGPRAALLPGAGATPPGFMAGVLPASNTPEVLPQPQPSTPPLPNPSVSYPQPGHQIIEHAPGAEASNPIAPPPGRNTINISDVLPGRGVLGSGFGTNNIDASRLGPNDALALGPGRPTILGGGMRNQDTGRMVTPAAPSLEEQVWQHRFEQDSSNPLIAQLGGATYGEPGRIMSRDDYNRQHPSSPLSAQDWSRLSDAANSQVTSRAAERVAQQNANTNQRSVEQADPRHRQREMEDTAARAIIQPTRARVQSEHPEWTADRIDAEVATIHGTSVSRIRSVLGLNPTGGGGRADSSDTTAAPSNAPPPPQPTGFVGPPNPNPALNPPVNNDTVRGGGNPGSTQAIDVAYNTAARNSGAVPDVSGGLGPVPADRMNDAITSYIHNLGADFVKNNFNDVLEHAKKKFTVKSLQSWYNKTFSPFGRNTPHEDARDMMLNAENHATGSAPAAQATFMGIPIPGRGTGRDVTPGRVDRNATPPATLFQ